MLGSDGHPKEERALCTRPCSPNIVISGKSSRKHADWRCAPGRRTITAAICKSVLSGKDGSRLMMSGPSCCCGHPVPTAAPQPPVAEPVILHCLRLAGRPADVIAAQPSQLRLQALAIRTQAAGLLFLPPRTIWRRRGRPAATVVRRPVPRQESPPAAVDSTLVCRWSSFSPSGWAAALGAEGDRHNQPSEWQRRASGCLCMTEGEAAGVRAQISVFVLVFAVLSSTICNRSTVRSTLSRLRTPVARLSQHSAATTRTSGSAKQRHRIPQPVYPHSTQCPRLRQHRSRGRYPIFCQQRTLDIISGIAQTAGLPNKSSSLDITHFPTLAHVHLI